jgi:ATP-dependent RNA helicase DHX36
MRRGLRRGLGILLVPLPNAPSRALPISLAALLLHPHRLNNGFSRRSLCTLPGGGRAVEQFSDDEYDHEYEDLRVRATPIAAGAQMIMICLCV